jgi:2-keto-4-pentenoate hydratase
MDKTHIAEAANVLVGARRARSRVELPPPANRPATVAEAHAIQDAVTATLGTPVGAFKANAPSGAEPTRGVIYAATIHASPSRIPAELVPQCGVEGEVAFVFRADLPPRPTPYSRAEVAAVLDACPAIEVVTSRYTDAALETGSPLDKLADCISNGAFVHGAVMQDWQALDLGKLRVTLTVNGTPVLDQVGGHPTGDPLGIAVALVEMMRGAGGVKAGQFVTCGSCTGLRYLKPGDVCGVRFDGLGAAEVTFSP